MVCQNEKTRAEPVVGNLTVFKPAIFMAMFRRFHVENAGKKNDFHGTNRPKNAWHWPDFGAADADGPGLCDLL